MAPPTLTAADLSEHPNDVVTGLVNQGILRPSKSGASVPCPDCGNLLHVQVARVTISPLAHRNSRSDRLCSLQHAQEAAPPVAPARPAA